MIGTLRTLMLFYKRHLRVQPLRELMAVLGVSAGVALLFAIQVTHRSITGSFQEVARGVAGRATLEVAARSPEGFDQSAADAIEHMGGVRAEAPILQLQVVAGGPQGHRALTLVGSTEQLPALGGNLARRFQHAGESARKGLLVLTGPTARAIGVRAGQPVTIANGGHSTRLPLAASLSAGEIGPVADSPVAAAPLPVVQSVAGASNRITRVLIEPAAGSERIVKRELLARYGATLNVRSVDTEASLLGGASGPEAQVTLLFSVISLVAGMILAYNALLLASDERRRFIVYLVETGTPDSMIVASLVFDALVLGLLGALVGLIAGDVVSLLAFRATPGYIAAAFAIGGQRVVGASTVAIALGGGLVAAFAAALLPAFAALRAGAAAEPEAVGRTLLRARRLRLSNRTVFSAGAALVCLSLTVAAVKPETTVVALVALAAGIVSCLPAVLRRLLILARWLSRKTGDAAARVAVAELRDAPGRSVALLATGTVSVFLMVLIGGAVGDVQHAVRRGAGDLLSGAEVWVKPGGAENVYTTEPFAAAETERRLRQQPFVRSVAPWRDSFLDLPGRRVWVLGVPSEQTATIAPSQLVRGSLAVADRLIRDGGWVALSETIAQERHLRIGDAFRLPTPTGAATVRLAATIANYGWLPGAIVMSSSEHARLWHSANASQLAVALRPGISPEAGRRAVEAALPAGSTLTVATAQERRSEVSAVLGSTLSRLDQTTIVVLIATIGSVLTLMIAAISQRRSRLDSLLSIGVSDTQLARLIFYESGCVLLIGCLIGMAFGLAGQYLIDGWLRHTTGSPVTFVPAWELALRTIAITAAIAALASLLTVVRGGRLQPRMTFSTE